MKRGKVLVSVVMSVYNDEQYLKESLDSIFAQTISDFELIIAVSYTHLDVYKRQWLHMPECCMASCWA